MSKNRPLPIHLALSELRHEWQAALCFVAALIGVLAPLMEVARPGLRLHVDLEASARIGAPLVTVLPAAPALDGLTKRQRQVAELIIEGLSNRAIADRLGVSLFTVKDHVHAILKRLELPSRAALISSFSTGTRR